ncbi:hypothetical protein GQ607_015832 [Colletotrichum asianum]|uniref:Uncharacterized protein n=1 Tax=Colletotrichum asianum TaxID=702518 RepID=A0A8H3ZKI2_9PEZI|nr:hypothetical protein GQ607_015832 [Colletotrichum asianum]
MGYGHQHWLFNYFYCSARSTLPSQTQVFVMKVFFFPSGFVLVRVFVPYVMRLAARSMDLDTLFSTRLSNEARGVFRGACSSWTVY